MVKVILGDCQALFRTGIARVLSLEDDFRVVAQGSAGSRILAAVRTFRGALVIVASILELDMTELVSEAHAAHSRVLVIVEDAEPFHPYIGLGVAGAIYRSTTCAAFVESVREVLHSDRFVPPGLTTPGEDLVGARARAQLTPKEMRVLALLVEGMKNKDIAQRLDTTEQVIKNHLRNMYDKTGVSDRLELALFTLHHRALATAAAEVSAALQEVFA